MERLRILRILGLGKRLEHLRILRILGLEERVDSSEKLEILILAQNRVVKSWGVRSCASHSRVRDPLGFWREN